jgi:prepilin peptidase CpaA
VTGTALLILLLLVAVRCDFRSGRIPNRLTVTAALAGLAFSLAPGGIGLGEAAGGMAIGFAALLPLYAFRAMGAGDVKLMAAAGSFLGTGGVFVAVLCTFALGGLLSIACAWKAGVLTRLFANLRLFAYASAVRIAGKTAPSADDLALTQARAPFALAIAGGVLFELFTRYLSDIGA